MTQSSSVKIGWIVMFIMGIYIAVLGLLWMFGTESLTVAGFAPHAGQSWSDFAANNPKAAEMMLCNNELIGALSVVIGLVFAMMAWNAYRKAEKWAWYTFLFAGMLGWAGGLGHEITLDSPSGIVLPMIGIALLLIGLVIPARAILGGKPAK